MADKYLASIAGQRTEVEATVTSAGAGNAGDIVALDGTGKLDNSVLPTGVGPEVVVLASSENLTAGDFVNIWNDSGTPKARKADATSVGKEANGFVLANVTSPANATVYLAGINNQVSGLTGGTNYFLSASTPGGIVSTAPSTAGNVVQYIGKASGAAAIYFVGSNLGEVKA